MRTPGCPSALRLDEWVFGRRTGALAVHVGGCAHCTARIVELEAEKAAFALRARPQAFVDAVLARKRPGWGWPRFVIFALAACALLFVLRPRDDAEDAYKSGGPQALLFVKQAEQVMPWEPERVLRAGDVLQLVMLTPRAAHVAVVDVEEGGAASLLHAGPLHAGRNPLPRAFALDGWTGPERLVVIFADKEIADPVGEAKRGRGVVFPLRRAP